MKIVKKITLLLAIISVITFAAACGSSTNGSSSSEKENGNSSNNATNELEGSVNISGSSAMQQLVAAAAEQFMDKHSKVNISVNAGGSGTGLSQVSEGSVDIGNSDVFAEEKEGIPADELVNFKVAVVGMAAAVHPEVGIDNISKADLIKVFTGEITNWKELGGKDQKIILVNRPDSSGTRATFVNFALDGATPAEGITEDSSNTVKKIISETKGTIGYLALSYFTDDLVKALSIDGVQPTDENIQTGQYPIWAYQHSYTKGEPTGVVKAFLDYMLSDEVQTSLLPELGYIPVTKMEVERAVDGTVTPVSKK
ncbi:phosphate ABC transporter substrate-binding protein [Bacillus kwashiorkori]|uniref:phosphate ABC transporter substrate-binding protein n=1 Tax=Bacillus kwashiorkori TaxID=1522318 RepID=UPI000783C297|nr:phosphate ABC transporter substrate-binding protein [Bacillus kwashiorkori]